MSNLILPGQAEAPSIQHSRCIVTGCAGESRWKPILLVKPIGYRFSRIKPVELPIPHNGYLCQEHRDLPISQLLNEEELNQIKAHLQDCKVATPDWSTLRVGLAVVK